MDTVCFSGFQNAAQIHGNCFILIKVIDNNPRPPRIVGVCINIYLLSVGRIEFFKHIAAQIINK